MSHPDGDGGTRRLADHVAYLQKLVAAGALRASGRLIGTRLRSGFLIFTVPDRATVEALVAEDPFAVAGLIESLTINQWGPLFVPSRLYPRGVCLNSSQRRH
jgi:uncharacterized protein YciI